MGGKDITLLTYLKENVINSGLFFGKLQKKTSSLNLKAF